MTETYTGGPDKPTIVKDPAEVLDYTFDWSAYLADITDTIASVVFDPVGVVVDSFSNTTTSATAWVSGGTNGTTAYVTCAITTAEGRTAVRSIYLKIKDR
jgi:hypothetical protein